MVNIFLGLVSKSERLVTHKVTQEKNLQDKQASRRDGVAKLLLYITSLIGKFIILSNHIIRKYYQNGFFGDFILSYPKHRLKIVT